MLVFQFVFSHLLPKNYGLLKSSRDGRAIFRATLHDEVFPNLYQACSGRDPCEKATPVELEFLNPYNSYVSV